MQGDRGGVQISFHTCLYYKVYSTLLPNCNTSISCKGNTWALGMMMIKFVWQIRIFFRVKWISRINQDLSFVNLCQIDTLLVLIVEIIMTCHEVGSLQSPAGTSAQLEELLATFLYILIVKKVTFVKARNCCHRRCPTQNMKQIVTFG